MGRQCRIVVVDDEPSILRLVAMVLQELDCRVDSLLRAEDAKEILDNEKVDLLITDEKLPGMQGSELIEHARRGQRISTVLISGQEPPQEFQADRFVPKPFDPDVLLKIVRDLLTQRD